MIERQLNLVFGDKLLTGLLVKYIYMGTLVLEQLRNRITQFDVAYKLEIVASFPGLPLFCSSVCVQYNTRKRALFRFRTERKPKNKKKGEAWEEGY